MAYSSSIKRAQAIKLCELCQKDSIKWRCIDCDKCLCDKCKTSHLRIPVTAQHQIVTIGTPLQNVQKKIVIDNIPCKDHPLKMTCLFCRSCDSLICPECASSSHKKHDFVPIESALDEKLDNLRGIREKINANLKFCESKTSEMQDIKPQYNAIFNEFLAKIKQTEQQLINFIRKYSNDLQEKVEEQRSQVNRALSNIEQDVDKTMKNFVGQRDEIDAILSSCQGSVIFKASMTIKDIEFDSLPNPVQQFIPETESTEKIQELFGSLGTISIPTTNILPGINFEVIKTFTTDLPLIDKVVTLNETSAWINCFNRQVIRKVNIQDNNMTTSQEVSLMVTDLALTSKNELLLSMGTGSDVKLLKRSGEIVPFVTFSRFIPYGIHVTKDNDVIVGVKEPGNTYTPTDQSQRAVIVYSMDGQQKHKYQYDQDGNRLFTVPSRIMTHNNNNILVVDRTSSHTGRVVVLNKEGNLKWLYEGYSKINTSKQFNPMDIIITEAGHIIVSDKNSHGLHVLSQDGEVLTCKDMGDMGIERPWGLDIDNKGRLWVGRDTGSKDRGAKLHIIKLISGSMGV